MLPKSAIKYINWAKPARITDSAKKRVLLRTFFQCHSAYKRLPGFFFLFTTLFFIHFFFKYETSHTRLFLPLIILAIAGVEPFEW
jgi:hypothetical protein